MNNHQYITETTGFFITLSCGDKHWYNNDGKLHREDGPAVEYPDGENLFYLNGAKMTKKEFQDKVDSDTMV